MLPLCNLSEGRTASSVALTGKRNITRVLRHHSDQTFSPLAAVAAGGNQGMRSHIH